MDRDTAAIIEAIEEFDTTPESVAVELRMSLVAIVLRHMRIKRWSQRILATQAGVAESFLSRVLHAENNSTIDTFANLLHALDARGRIEEIGVSIKNMDETGGEAPPYFMESKTDATTQYTQAPQAVGGPFQVVAFIEGYKERHRNRFSPGGVVTGSAAHVG